MHFPPRNPRESTKFDQVPQILSQSFKENVCVFFLVFSKFVFEENVFYSATYISTVITGKL